MGWKQTAILHLGPDRSVDEFLASVPCPAASLNAWRFKGLYISWELFSIYWDSCSVNWPSPSRGRSVYLSRNFSIIRPEIFCASFCKFVCLGLRRWSGSRNHRRDLSGLLRTNDFLRTIKWNIGSTHFFINSVLLYLANAASANGQRSCFLQKGIFRKSVAKL